MLVPSVNAGEPNWADGTEAPPSSYGSMKSDENSVTSEMAEEEEEEDIAAAASRHVHGHQRLHSHLQCEHCKYC